MKALIQHNFRGGLGDMYCDMTEYMTISKDLKEMGYEVHLIFCLEHCRYSKEKVFYKIFSEETINFFSSIEETFIPIKEKKYQEYEYYYSAHAPQSPGIHRWDLFLDKIPNNEIRHIRFQSNYYEFHKLDKVRPKFSEYIENKVSFFENNIAKKYSFLNIRIYPHRLLDKNELEIYLQKINNFIYSTNEVLYLGTYHQYVYDFFLENKKIIKYPFTTMKYIDNDPDSIDNYKGEDIFFERFCDIIAEMILIKNSNKIYYDFSSGWISNFYFYALCENNFSIEFADINNFII